MDIYFPFYTLRGGNIIFFNFEEKYDARKKKRREKNGKRMVKERKGEKSEKKSTRG